MAASCHSSKGDKGRVIAGRGYDGFEKVSEGSCTSAVIKEVSQLTGSEKICYGYE